MIERIDQQKRKIVNEHKAQDEKSMIVHSVVFVPFLLFNLKSF